MRDYCLNNILKIKQMNTPKLNIELIDNFLSKNNVITNIDIVPCPMVILMSLTLEVFMNKKARAILETPIDEEMDVRGLLNANKHIMDIDKFASHESLTNKSLIINLLSGKEIRIEYSFNRLKDDILGLIYFITFNKKELSIPSESVFSMSMVKEDISKLKDNLNNEGKEVLNEILKQYFNKEHKQLSLEDLVNYEKELQIIQKEFPLLSRREVLLCGLLVHDMEFNDIAALTNRSLNSIFVTIHRINKKTNIPNKTELTNVLKKIINNNID